MFQGDGFDRIPALTMARSMLLDLFRGAQVPNINLAGLDRVMFVTHVGDDLVVVRQYRIKLKRSGTKVRAVEVLVVLSCIQTHARHVLYH